MSIRSGDIRDQSRKLPKIAPNFGHFVPSQILYGGTPGKISVYVITLATSHIPWYSCVRLRPLPPML